MGRNFNNSDPTASQAVGRAERLRRTFHRSGCSVDGGPEVHGRPWRGRNMRGLPGQFHCPKCATSVEDRMESALRVLDGRRP